MTNIQNISQVNNCVQVKIEQEDILNYWTGFSVNWNQFDNQSSQETDRLQQLPQSANENFDKYFRVLVNYCQNYRLLEDPVVFKSMAEKLKQMKKYIRSQIYISQTAAVIVFQQLQKTLKLKKIDFCKSNFLNIRIFNQRYKVYYKLFKINRICSMRKLNIEKQQEKQLKSSQNQFDQKNNQKISNQSLQQIIQPQIDREWKLQNADDVRNAFELVFNIAFRSAQIQIQRRTIIDKMTKKLTNLDAQFLKRVSKIIPEKEQIFYLVLGLCRYFGTKAKISDLQQAIKYHTSVKMQRSNLFKKYENEIARNAQIQSIQRVNKRFQRL